MPRCERAAVHMNDGVDLRIFMKGKACTCVCLVATCGCELTRMLAWSRNGDEVRMMKPIP